MPKNTLTSYENKIKQYKRDTGADISRGQIKTVANTFFNRQARMSNSDLERVFMHSDPTPREAIKNIEKEQVAA